MNLDKSVVTNIIAFALVVLGLTLAPPVSPWLLSIGLFALSGSVTNWLAIHMLFERVPGFYGSGVVPLHFDEFKRGIRKLIMQQFFNQQNIDKFLHSSSELSASFDDEILKLIDKLDLEKAFESLLDVIMASSFGGMLGMLGGRDALNGLKEPFVNKMREYFSNVVDSPEFRDSVANSIKNAGGDTASLLGKIEHVVESRLDELTPELVKEIVQAMIKKHLGWLVVWGGVLGGLIGFLVELAQYM
ncbi:MAG: DUF445 family protein [Pseudohongiellaceae bacterium]|nr:DUF445 family protein [Pseudohongiellaceae bacterium]